MTTRASVIIRTKDSGRTLAQLLWLLRGQTVESELIVVDSGSRDDTLTIARQRADLVLQMPAETFSFGRALNIGAAAARGPIHFALSSHSFPPSDRWIEQSLAKYDRPDVAGTNGALAAPGSSEPLTATFYQTLPDALAHPEWGFSNTGSSWRAEIWAVHRFDEELPACEDKEWAMRVLADGWAIAFDPRLCTSTTHRTRHGATGLYQRTRREYEALASFAPVPPGTLTSFLGEWLTDLPMKGHYRRMRRRLNHLRFAELLGKYQGLRAGGTLGARASSGRKPTTPVGGTDGAAAPGA